MGFIDAFWHLLNFFAPALGVGFLASGLAKIFWLKELRGVSWVKLGSSAALASALALCAGLAVFGHDGKMASYAGMVVVCGLMLWLVGFGIPRR